eukprot:7790997-Karenia_brevis.AAC.1
MRRNVAHGTLKNKIGLSQRTLSVMLTKPKGLKNSAGQLSLQIKTMMKKTHYLEAVRVLLMGCILQGLMT